MNPLVGLMRLLALLPLSWLRGLGWLLGQILFRTSARRGRVVAANIALCFPELQPQQQRAQLRRGHRRRVGGDVIGQGPAHGVGQRQFCQQVRLECCKALAKVNQSMQLAFDLRFAFFSRIEGVVVRINHGGSPQRNAAMITSRGPLVRPGRSMAPAESRI